MTDPLPPLHRLFPRVFYGWVVVAGAALLSFVTVGVGFYSLPVLLDGLSQVHGWSKASLSGATSLYFVVSAVTGSVVGRMVDRYGARGFMVAGAVCMAVALVGIGRVQAPAQLYVLYPLMAAGFAMSAGVPSSAIITRWFVARRALAMAIAQTGVSVGGVVLVPLATGIIESSGLRAATLTLAAILVVLALPVVALVLRFDPVPHGLAPDGGAEPPPENPLLRPEVQQRRWSTREAAATSTFWLLAAAFSAILFAQQGMLVHQIAFLRGPLGAAGAALAVSTTAAGSIVARLAVGTFADRVDKLHLALGLVLIQAGVYLAFGFADERISFYLASLGLGFTIGNLFMMQSLLVGELFGMASYGTVLGSLQLVTQVTGGLGPLAMGLLFEAFGGYQTAVRVLVGIALGAALALARVRPTAQARSGSGEEGELP